MSTSEWTPDIEISPQRKSVWAELPEVWNYRELIFYLVLREIQGRYRNTALGISWIVLKPALNTVLFAFLFGLLLKLPSDNLPYPLFLLAGTLPWGFFSNAVTRAANSLRDNTQAVSKVYFPRLVLPLAAVLSGFVDLVAALPLLLGAMVLYGSAVHSNVLWLPVFLIASVLPTLAMGLWMAVLASRYKDITYALGFVLQGIMYATPIVYPLSSIGPQWQELLQLNPMTGVIMGTRWALFGSGSPPDQHFIIALAVSLILLLAALYFFQRSVRSIVDTI